LAQRREEHRNGHRHAHAHIPLVLRLDRRPVALHPLPPVLLPATPQRLKGQEIAAPRGEKGVGEVVTGQILSDPARHLAVPVGVILEENVGVVLLPELLLDPQGLATFQDDEPINAAALGPAVAAEGVRGGEGGEGLAVDLLPQGKIGARLSLGQRAGEGVQRALLLLAALPLSRVAFGVHGWERDCS